MVKKNMEQKQLPLIHPLKKRLGVTLQERLKVHSGKSSGTNNSGLEYHIKISTCPKQVHESTLKSETGRYLKLGIFLKYKYV